MLPALFELIGVALIAIGIGFLLGPAWSAIVIGVFFLAVGWVQGGDR